MPERDAAGPHSPGHRRREAPGRFLTYFSHSYNPTHNDVNLFFWKIFSGLGLYFAIDPRPEQGSTEQPRPMSVPYLEWLMSQSSCFVAVVPRRAAGSGQQCSPYQILETDLALRANKPTLIFAESGLPRGLFKCADHDIQFFNRARYEDQRADFEKVAKRLAALAALYPSPIARALKPIGLLLDERQSPYANGAIASIRETVARCGLDELDIVSPISGGRLASLIDELRQYEVVIAEIRPPYIPIDIVATLYSRGIPTIWISYLDEDEVDDGARRAMRLYAESDNRVESPRVAWPTVLRSTQLDEQMQPVLFWRRETELVAALETQLRRLTEQRRELLRYSEAQQYFFDLDEQTPKVFVSNASSQNGLAGPIAQRLKDRAVDSFHYMERDAIPAGSPDFLATLYHEIDEAEIFVALIDDAYVASPWCVKELERARGRLERDQAISIYVYIVGDMPFPSTLLGRIHAVNLAHDALPDAVDRVVDDVLKRVRPIIRGSL